jgi:protein O-mannosyl-transferase
MMGSPHAPPLATGAARSPRRTALAGGVLLLAVFAAYANSWTGPFVYDDKDAIVRNLTLRHLWPLSQVLVPPGGGVTTSGRPALNLSLALNYAAGGLDVRGYHLTNILIHACAALALFGLVRRTLLLPSLRRRWGDAALPVAFTVAALWGLHPLQTEAVTYIVQRAESLMGLCYLLTLYGFVRSLDSPAPRRWQALAFGACLVGMATKENMVSAPVLVLLFDRAFVAGGFAEAWRRRRRFYAALAATWILLAGLLASTGGNRGGSAGFGVAISWWDYALTQFPALVQYLRLSIWPAPLVFEYGPFRIDRLAQVAPQALFIVLLIGSIGWALGRNAALGWLGAAFLAILAPTSLMPGITQRIVEHRMYLSLAPVLVLVVAGVQLRGGRRGLAALWLLAAGLGWLTFQRNADYRSEIALWGDTAAKVPGNAGAHASLGAALAEAGRLDEAIREDEVALRLGPGYVSTRNNYATALIAVGRVREAVEQLEISLHEEPDNAQAHLNLGTALDILKRTPEAVAHYEAALRRDPDFAAAHNNLGDALSRMGRSAAGIAQLQEALRLQPDLISAHYNLAAALARAGRLPEAQAQFEAGLRLHPADAEAHANWGGVLLATGHPAEAAAQFAAARRLQPASATHRYNLGNALAAAGRYDDAVPEFQAALRLQPDYPDAEDNLGNALTMLHRESEALPHYEAALRLKPGYAQAHNNLGLALARLGRLPEAAAQFAEAVRCAPNYQEARDNLAQAQRQLAGASP